MSTATKARMDTAYQRLREHLAYLGLSTAAEELARAALQIARHTDGITTVADTLMDLAEVLRISGRGEEGRSVLREALDLYGQKGNVISAAQARTLLAELEQ